MKQRNTKNNRKTDGKFKKKNIKHGQAESSRKVFGKEKPSNFDEIL